MSEDRGGEVNGKSDAAKHLVQETLKDGSKVTLRAIHPDDENRIVKAFHALEPQTIRLRFFYAKQSLTDAELRRLQEMDYQRYVGLVATVQNAAEEVIIGFGEYVARGRSAEVAFVVEEDWQGRGVARLLLQHLVRIALEHGVIQFEAEVLKGNEPMLAVFRHSGLPMTTRNGDDAVLVTLVLNKPPSPETTPIDPDEMSMVRSRPRTPLPTPTT